MDEAENRPPFPDEIHMEGVTFKIVATRRGLDKTGAMHYRMTYEGGDLVTITSVRYGRGDASLIFETPAGKAAFDFRMREE